MSKTLLQRKSSSLSIRSVVDPLQETKKPESVNGNNTEMTQQTHTQASSSFAGLSLSAKKRTRLLMEVTAFVSAMSNIHHRLRHEDPDLLGYDETVRHGKLHHQSWVDVLYKRSQAWFDQVPDKELSLAVDILRRTRIMIRNRFSGELAEKYCDLPARVTFSCLRARNLEPRDYKHSPGSYCVMKMDGLMYRTSSQRSLNPVWNEEFEFIVQDVDSVMSISVSFFHTFRPTQ